LFQNSKISWTGDERKYPGGVFRKMRGADRQKLSDLLRGRRTTTTRIMPVAAM
jgi:hypothetical protein